MKKVLIAILIVFLLVILLAAGFIYTFDANKYKNEVAEVVATLIGRQVDIGGDVKISIYPWIGVKLNDLTIENNAGFTKKTFAKIGQFDINIQIMPLLEDRLEIDKLVLHRLSVSFETNAAGKNNWSDLFGASENAGVLEKFGLKEMKIAGVELTDSNLSWLEVNSGKQFKISKMSLDTEAVIKGKPVPISIKAYIKSNQPEWQASVSATTNLDFNENLPAFNANALKLKAKVIFPGQENNKFSFAMISNSFINYQDASAKLTKTRFSLLGLVMSGSFDVENLFSVPTIEGPLKVKSFEVAELAKRFKIDIPVMANENSLKSISLKSSFRTNFNYVYLDDLVAKFDQSLVKGFVHIEKFSKPVIRYDLDIDQLALHDYVTSANEKSSDEILLPLELVRSIDLEGAFDIEALLINDLELTNFHIESQVKDGIVNAGPVTTLINESEINATMLLDASASPTSKLRVKATNIDARASINPLLKSIMGETSLLFEGVLTIDANLRTKGLSLASHKKSANGIVSIDMVDATVQGIDLDYVSRKVVANYGNKNNFRTRASYVPEYNPDKNTVVKKLNAKFDAANGKFRNTDLQLQLENVTVTGSGTVDFITKKLDFRPVVDTSVKSRVDIRDKLRDHPMEYHVHGDFENLKTKFESEKYDLLVDRLLLQDAKRRRNTLINNNRN